MLHHALKDIPTPAYVVDEKRLKSNLKTAERIKIETGCRLLLATKAFALPAVFPLMRTHLDGTTASGLFEARLGRETFGKEVHVYAPAYKEEEFEELLCLADHIYFNSAAQFLRYSSRVKAKGKKIGLRINPGYSNATIGGFLYDPCAPGSRFGVLPREFDKVPWQEVDILHVHALCDSMHNGSINLIDVVAKQFCEIVKRVEAVNFGGGHYINDPLYDADALIQSLCCFRAQFPDINMIIEPGGGLLCDAGYFVASVLDFTSNEKDIALLDASAYCHLPIILQANFRQPIVGSGKWGEYAHSYRLGANTCMAGDIFGDYSFKKPLAPGDRIIFAQGLEYSFVQGSTFNGMPMPNYFMLHENGRLERLSDFGYNDYRSRLGFDAK